MKHLLLIQIGKDTWKTLFSGGYGEDSLNKCLDESVNIPDSRTWMIVAEVRTHGGIERDIIATKSDSNTGNIYAANFNPDPAFKDNTISFIKSQY